MCWDKVGVEYRRYPYLVKDQVHIMARTAQISKEKPHSIIHLRHEGQSIQNISRTLKVSSSAVACVVPTGKHGGGGVLGGGALLVILSEIYLEFTAHLPSMATTAFCSDTPSHLVCPSWDYLSFFNRTMTQHTSSLCKGYLTKKESDGVLHQITWPPQQPDRNQLRWFGMGRTTV